ncbi:hypothetical protein KJA14_02275 [Patescibacteria group bacterium]|nr:hypothetical protein [Patescibacteria group bacterium]
MKITGRQEQILNSVVNDYIDLAQPISSELLEKRHDFEISPATIRIEMQKLTNQGYLYQPHTSAGRIPTDKGFRFFVDRLLKKKSLEFPDKKFSKEIQRIERKIEDSLKFFQEITKILASTSSNLALFYLFDEKIFWKEGWKETLAEPEFENTDIVSEFTEMVDNLEENIKDFCRGDFGEIKISIGRENPRFLKTKKFSIISSTCYFPKKRKGMIAILGPKRMEYPKNISLINSLVKILEKY